MSLKSFRSLQEVRNGRFRADLLSRIDLWTFRLPGLAERREDVEPNLAYELEQIAARTLPPPGWAKGAEILDLFEPRTLPRAS